jgi:sulfatase modifying factor 1
MRSWIFASILVVTGCGRAVETVIPSDAAPLSPSCSGGREGQTNCGVNQEDCCLSPTIPGGTFDRIFDIDGGRPTNGTFETTLSTYRLDTYEVTVGRFRQFVIETDPFGEDGGVPRGWVPPEGSGKHSYLSGGKGLTNIANPGIYETGWQSSWNKNIAATDDNLTIDCLDPDEATWTSAPGSQENFPINCVNWYEAYAFCIWDRGFLPSEAEWAYASAGGSEEREYPWGDTAPGHDSQYEIWGCYWPSQVPFCQQKPTDIAPVGTAFLGTGRWGQLDLNGNVDQWVLDTYPVLVEPPESCTNCARLVPGALFRGDMGGEYDSPEPVPSFSVGLVNIEPTARLGDNGIRCARSPQ